ncbi:golvesin C-terminal-like domain-containing protein [Kitasatospora sp. NBC_01302]|uniref:golvesin C-terminal-like domain-containing protein n=1 Tax=Kitasatospora sp. NBC_01302 TaxID=2903575 RepID=UPI002E1014B8|nr:SGNH/GDSL hydrolase family protein [Kitasatospora sp. NBC_01302]
MTTAGDAAGFRILAADSGQAYQWRTVATLSEPGFATDLWVGNSCVTASGKRAAVVYAPRQFTNQPELMQRGAFAAIVDLESGAVTKLPDQVSLAYFDPGCGAGENAVFTQGGDADLGQTRLLTIDTSTGKPVDTATVAGQLTSAVPVKDGVVGAAGSQLTKVDASGHASVLATTSGPASAVHPDADGGVTFLDRSGDTTVAKRLAEGKVATLAQSRTGDLGLQAGADGKVFLTGQPQGPTSLPPAVKQLAVSSDAAVSTQGALAVDQAVSGRVRSLAANPLAAPGPGDQGPIEIQSEVPATGKKLSFSLTPVTPDATAAAAAAASPALTDQQPAPAPRPQAGSLTGTSKPRTTQASATATPRSAMATMTSATTTGSATATVDDDRACSVARNDPNQQAYQPTPAQVEWAADMAVRGDLTKQWVRQSPWRGMDGLGTVDPQGMFPLPSLAGAPGGHIPPQVLLGILTQESNLWQAEGSAIPGQLGNPLTGNFYGHPRAGSTNIWQVDWSRVDCGYGMGQQTDGMHAAGQMRPGDQAWPADKQKAVALDYASNIAVAAQTLADKWNELHDPNAPMKLNSDNPASIENWFTAAWDYNAGFTRYDPANPSAPWGLGYLNNPANPIYKPDRAAFLNFNHYADAAHPQNWPYQEKVLGWAAWPINTGRSYDNNGNLNHGNTAGYAAAWWDNDDHRSLVKPPLYTFCNTQNNCDATKPPRCEVDHLGPTCDTPYWWHSSTAWKSCTSDCGHETMTYKTLRTEPGDGTTGAPDCTRPGSSPSAVPSGTLVIDSLSGASPPMRSDCDRVWQNAGTFGFNFQPDGDGHYEAKADLHQISGGYGAHFWFAHTRNADNAVDRSTTDVSAPGTVSGPMAITGTWQLSQPLNSWTRVFVHLPDTGSETQQATYTIHTGFDTENRTLNVASNTNHWVSLGVFQFAPGGGIQGLELSNYTQDGIGAGGEDLAWDAAAFQPLPDKPKDFVVQMGDSYSSGEGAQPYIYGTDTGPYADQDKQTSPGRSWNACRRSQNSWIRQTVIPGRATSIGSAADSNDSSLDYHSTACSGALTHSIGNNGAGDAQGNRAWGVIGQHHEVPQLMSGFLDANTTLVALTAGGNDAGFSDIVTSCAEPSKGCPSDASVTGQINAAVGSTRDLLYAIHAKAPNAKIVLLGYPELFTVSDWDLGCSVMTPGNAAKLNDWAVYMGHQQQSTVAGLQSSVPVTFYSPMTEFSQHGVCSHAGAAINDVVAAPSTKGGGDFSCPGNPVCPSMESYHPNNAGTKLYAQALANALTAAKY